MEHSSKIYEYCCPNCERTLATGKLETLYVVCPDCSRWLHFSLKENKIVNALPVVPNFEFGGVLKTKKYRQKKYGWDRLAFGQMHSTKEEALASGHSHYFTGKPCRNGHMAPRTKRGECNECVRLAGARYLKKYKEAQKNKQKK